MNDTFSVPWMCKTELLYVYHNLYSDTVRDRQNAIQHIAVWKARCNPWQSRLPVSIICSADLVSAELDHHIYTRQESALAENKVNQRLALALIRFVNFITERYQHDSSNVAIPIHRICSQIGIPAWIVSLRHEATHRALPALSVLIRGTQWAINWLKENFWEQQIYATLRSTSFKILADGESVSAVSVKADESYETTEDDTRKISCLFVAYQQIRCQELSGGCFSQCDISTSVECKQVIKEIKKLFSLVKINRVLSVLVQIGYLLPTDDQLVHFGIIPGVHSDEEIRCLLAVFWWPLLQEMNNIHVISELIQTLALLKTDHDCPGSRYIVIWLQLLLSHHTVKFNGGEKAKLFSNSPSFLELPWLQQCLQNPSQYHSDVLQVLCVELGLLMKKSTKNLSSLLNIYTGQGESELSIGPDSYPEQGSSELFTVPDSYTGQGESELVAVPDSYTGQGESELVAVPDSYTGQGESELSNGAVHDNCVGGNVSGLSWKLCTEKIDWFHLPIGIFPWQDPQCLFHSLNGYCESAYSQDDIKEHGICENVDTSSYESSAYCWNMNQHNLIRSQLIIYP